MTRLIKWLAFAVVLVLALAAASGYGLRYLVESSGAARLGEALSAKLGVPVRIGAVQFDVREWYRLRPALSLEGFTVGNAPGFRAATLLEAKRVAAQVALRPLLDRKIDVLSLELIEPELIIERAKDGTSNLEAVLRGMPASGAGGGGAAQPAGGAQLSIAELRIERGEIRYIDKGMAQRARAIQLVLRGFAPGHAVDLEGSALLYSGNPSNVKFQGAVGPFGGQGLPLAGRAQVLLALAEVPDAIRSMEFGTLLALPGDRARVSADLEVKGDLYGVLSGAGKVSFADVRIGRDRDHLLPLSGDAPVRITVRRIMSTPNIDLALTNAALQLGGGQWRGSLNLLLVGGVARGKSSGAIRNVEMNEFLSALTTATSKVYGVFEIPEYTLRFGGRDGAAIRRSLSGEGKLAISKGRFKALDMLASIRRVIENPKLDPRESTDTSGDTEFTTLRSGLRIENEVLALDGFQLGGPALQAGGDGTITFDQALDFKLDTMVRGRVAEMLGRVPVGTAPAEAPVPMFVRGTVARPVVMPDLKKLAIRTGQGYLEQVLKGKLPEPVKDIVPGQVNKAIEKLGEKLPGGLQLPGFRMPGIGGEKKKQ